MSVFKVGSNKSSQNQYPSVRPTLDLDFANTKTLDPRITFTRASGGSYYGANGLIKLAGVNEPRFDHDPYTGESLGFLVEEARTNLIKSSNNFIFNDWHFTQCQMTPNAGAAPDGTQTAALIQQTNGTSTRQFICTSYSVPSTGSPWTASVYVKQFNYDYVIFGAGDEDSNSRGDRFGYLQAQLRFQFSTKTLTVNPSTSWGGAVTESGYEELPNGWFRLWVSKASFPRANYWGIAVQETLGGSNSTISSDLNLVTGNGSSGVYFWGMQWESGSFRTSYIPTEASTRTRAADVASITGTNFSSWFNYSQSTMYTEGIFVGDPYDGDFGYLSTFDVGVNDGSFYSRIRLIDSGDYVVFQSTLPSSSSTTGNISISIGANAKNTKIKQIHSITNSASASAAVNGTLGTEVISSSIQVPDRVQFGKHGGAYQTTCYLRRFTYYPKRLPDAQLQVLTR